MKKRLSLFLMGIVLLNLAASQAAAETATEVLEKMIGAQGGRKALAAVQDTTIMATVEMIQFGLTGSMTLYQKEPDKMRMDIEVMGMLISQGFDGEKAWMTNPQTGGTEEMPDKFAQDMKRQSLGNDSLLHPEKYGIAYEFKGRETIKDKEYIVLEQTAADGHKTTIYIDPATYLTYKTKTTTLNQVGVEVLAETYLSDYTDVGETKVAHSMTVFNDGAEFMKMTISKVSYNQGLDDSLFKMSR